MELFRRAAVESTRADHLGEVMLSGPLSFVTLAGIAAGLALLVIGFICFGTYAKRVPVTGEIAPTAGMVIVRPPAGGIVSRREIEDGELVEKGAVLYRLEPNRRLTARGDTEALILASIRARRASIASDLERLDSLERSEREALEAGMTSLTAEQRALAPLIERQRERASVLAAAVVRYGKVADEGYVSQEFMQQKLAEKSGSEVELASLERDQAALRRQIVEQRARLAELPLRYRSLSAEKTRQLAEVDQELVQSEAQQELVVTAPVAGTATMVVGEPGQRVDPSSALLWIVPAHADLEVHLYVPTRAIASVDAGRRVQLRYRAYPYQQYGSQQGVVSQVSRTTFMPDEIARAGEVAGAREPYYRVKVRLASQTLRARGGSMPLLPGMLVDADILLEERRLFEWIWEPVNAIARR